MAYVKLFESILASTIWGEAQSTRIVWITMLALADRDGVVSASVPGLAHLARVSVDECSRALQSLTGPDPDSRTKAHDGRRAAEVEGGWRVLNYEYYRDKSTLEERREKDRLRQERKRERDLSRNVTPVTARHDLSPSQSQSQSQMQTQKKNASAADHPDLFQPEAAPKPKAPRRQKGPPTAAPASPNGAAPTPADPVSETQPQRLVRLFAESFEKTLGAPYQPERKDFVHASRLLAKHPWDEVEHRCILALEKAVTDPWWHEHVALGLVVSQWRALGLSESAPERRGREAP